MKAIQTDLLITSLRARQDHSLGFSAGTPELTIAEKVLFMELQNVPLSALLVPKDGADIGREKIAKEVQRFTQSERIRNKLFRLWEQDSEGLSWDEYYHDKTEKIIAHLDSKLHK